MEIRRLTDQNILEHEKLASQAFVFHYDEAEATALPSEIMLGAFTEEGRLAADMEIYDRVCFFGNETLRCAAVGGVASKPEYRRLGAVRAMFRELEAGRVLGQTWDIGILYPFSEPYYRKLGYAPVGTKLRVSVPFTEFADIPRASGARLYEGGDGTPLLSLYNSVSRHYVLDFRRDDIGVWDKEPYSEGVYTYILRDRGGQENENACATFSLDRTAGSVNVKEIFFTDREAMLGILGFLRCFDGNLGRIVFESLPADSPLLRCIADAGKAEILASHAGAVKILRPENVLRKHAWGSGAGSFVMRVNEWGTFAVTYENGAADIKKTDSPPDIVLGQTAAAKILFEGLYDERELSFLPDAQINGRVGDILRAFPRREVYFNDPF